MSRIPRVWKVTVREGKRVLARLEVWAPNRRLAILNTRFEHPRYWGYRLVLSPARNVR